MSLNDDDQDHQTESVPKEEVKSSSAMDIDAVRAIAIRALLEEMRTSAPEVTEYDIPGGRAAMARLESRREGVIDFDLEFAAETCSEAYNHRDFLKRHEVLEKGMWKREGASFQEIPWGCLPVAEDYSLPAHSAPDDRAPLSSAARGVDPIINSWGEYYAHRGITDTSPVAIILSFPLTLYYVLTRLKLCFRGTAIVHLIGVEKELDQLLGYQELHRLLPDLRLQIVMVGPSVPPSLHKATSRKFSSRDGDGCVEISFFRGLYHDFRAIGVQLPSLVLGPNLGLFATNKYPGLAKTAWLLAKEGCPVVLTDFTELGADQTRHIFQNLGVSLSWPVEINPFRRPVVQKTSVGYNGTGFDIPLCANGFILGVNT